MNSLNLKPGGHIAPFFILNDDLHKDRLREMVRECSEAGFDAIILHPRPGLRTPYLSNAWFAAIEFCISEAQQLGLKTWLYDEYPWPSGAAGGRVIQRNADFAEKHLSINRYTLKGGGLVRQVLGGNPVLEAFLAPLSDEKTPWANARVVTSSVGMRNTTWITRNWDSRGYYLPKYVPRYECRRAMEYLPEQVFEDELPEGDWALITFTVTAGSEFLEPFGHYVDLSTRAATEVFLEETHERYRKRFGRLFGSQILGIFTDEPKYRNVLPWSRTIAEAWTDYQRDPRALLALLPESETEELRQSYRQLTTNLYSENWIAPIHDWCRKEKLGLIGHISPEEDWWGECSFAGSILRHLRQFSVPGCDLIIPAVGDRAHPVLNFTPSLAVSAAAQAGVPHALCEVFGCSNYSLDLQTIKRVADWLMIFGINFIVPHGCFYSLAGPRRFDAPPTFLSPSTLHPFLAQWSAHIRETAETLGPGRPVDLALVRPMGHLFGLSENRQGEATRLFEQALEIAEHLLEQGLSFHWVDDSDLSAAQVREGFLLVGHAAYRQVIAWTELLPPQAAKTLKTHAIPTLSPAQALVLKGPLDCPEGDVRATLDAKGLWFCVNLSPEPRRFKISGMEAFLEGYESRWIVSGALPAVAQSHSKLCADWEVILPEENVFRLMEWTCDGVSRPTGPAYHSLMSESVSVKTVYGPVPKESELPVPHKLIYEASVTWEGARKALSLCLEEGAVEGDWQAFFNDTPLTDWQPRGDFFGGSEHELAPILQEGTNSLRLEITAQDARNGLWLEPVLRGDFVVTSPGRLHGRPARSWGNDWSRFGYPHYSGSMDFEQTFHWEESEPVGGAYLVFRRPPGGMVEVILNGVPLGLLLWAPWRLPIGEGLQPGLNRLRLRITNTLQNFMCGEARGSGPLGEVEIQTFCVSQDSHVRTPRRLNLEAEEIVA